MAAAAAAAAPPMPHMIMQRIHELKQRIHELNAMQPRSTVPGHAHATEVEVRVPGLTWQRTYIYRGQRMDLWSRQDGRTLCSVNLAAGAVYSSQEAAQIILDRLP